MKKMITFILSAVSFFLLAGLFTGCSKEKIEPTPSPVPEAGLDSGIKRDEKPRKYFTLSFDDGITQDAKIIEILKKYNMDCCTFMINSGLYGANWTWVGQQFNRPDVTHLRYTEEELLSGIYDGFDLEVHTMNHPSLKVYDNNLDKLIEEVQQDRENISKISGFLPVGMAWPGGDTEYTETTIKLIYENTDIRFGRGTTATYNFKLPQYFMQWMPTCGVCDPNLISLTKKFIKAECTEDMLFYVWGHGYELDLAHSWDTFEEMIRLLSQEEDIIFVTNAEFYQLFKDQIPSWK